MKTKKEIVDNWLPRYTGKNLEDFGKYILLTNFTYYVERFAQKFNVPVDGSEKNMPSATAEGITIINFGMGSPNAAIDRLVCCGSRPSPTAFWSDSLPTIKLLVGFTAAKALCVLGRCHSPCSFRDRYLDRIGKRTFG